MKISRSLLKQIAYWTLPPGIQSLIHARRGTTSRRPLPYDLPAEERAIIEKNRVLYRRHQGERCFILATGPSIKSQNLRPLANEICISVSNFFVHPDYECIRPQYHCIAPYHAPISEPGWQQWMDEAAGRVRNTSLFFGLQDRERNMRNGRFANGNVHFLSLLPVRTVPESLDIDLTHALPAPQSVPVMALFVALYLGCSEIFLLGCDHDWILNLKKSRHFYHEQQHALTRSGYDEWSCSDVEANCSCYVRLWQQYKLTREVAHRNSVKVFNATPGSLLDVFPRAHYESVIGPRTAVPSS